MRKILNKESLIRYSRQIVLKNIGIIGQKKIIGSRVLIVAISFIFAGAMGNIIDSVFYGIIFNDSHSQVASMFPPEGGYGTLFHGKVVDMLYFPLWEGVLPEWIPFWGGKYFTFFDPVFNIADSAITIGVCLLIFFKI